MKGYVFVMVWVQVNRVRIGVRFHVLYSTLLETGPAVPGREGPLVSDLEARQARRD